MGGHRRADAVELQRVLAGRVGVDRDADLEQRVVAPGDDVLGQRLVDAPGDEGTPRVGGGAMGVGRGIALGLGEAGATVYVTGRSVRGAPAVSDLPGTIEETAEALGVSPATVKRRWVLAKAWLAREFDGGSNRER